jgi:hypothetical protein
LNGSFTSAFATQGVKRLVTDRADQLRHSSLPPYEWAEMTNNIIAATKQEPTTVYLKYIASLQLDRSNQPNKPTRRPLPPPASLPASISQTCCPSFPHFRADPILMISNRITAPMVASTLVEIAPKPRWTPVPLVALQHTEGAGRKYRFGKYLLTTAAGADRTVEIARAARLARLVRICKTWSAQALKARV